MRRAFGFVMIPPRLILAPVDFSDCSRVSLAFAARLARQCRAELHVLHAESPLLEAAARSRSIDLAGQARAELRGFMETTCPGADGLPLYYVASGQPTDAICNAAARHRADVIVMGPHGLSRLQRVILGSTTRDVLLRATTDVIVVPPSWAAPAVGPALEGTGPVVAALRDPASGADTVAAAGALAGSLGTTSETVHFSRDEHKDAGEALLEYLAAPARQRAVLVLERSRHQGRTELGPTTRTLLTGCDAPMLWRA